jgi:hypothetical protein
MNGTAGQAQELQSIKSYLYQLHECLNYAFNNIDGDNMTEEARASLVASRTAAVKIQELSEENAKELHEIIMKLRAEIIATADSIETGTEAALDVLEDSIISTVASGYVARSQNDEMGTVAELKEYIASAVAQTPEAWEARFKSLEDITVQTEDAINKYKEEMETIIRLSGMGISIGKQNDEEDSPYAVLIDNSKLSFLYKDQEVAYVQYNKLYITSAELAERLSIGSAVNGGFFDFISTDTGMGLKWRGATNG